MAAIIVAIIIGAITVLFTIKNVFGEFFRIGLRSKPRITRTSNTNLTNASRQAIYALLAIVATLLAILIHKGVL